MRHVSSAINAALGHLIEQIFTPHSEVDGMSKSLLALSIPSVPFVTDAAAGRMQLKHDILSNFVHRAHTFGNLHLLYEIHNISKTTINWGIVNK